MANYYASARSNYFRVNDEKAFKCWAEECGLGTWTRNVTPKGASDEGTYFGVYSEDEGGWPSFRYDEERDECHDIDIFGGLARFLHEDDVAVLMEVGWENLRYLTGLAVAVNANGETRRVSLDDIYEIAESDLGAEPTKAEY